MRKRYPSIVRVLVVLAMVVTLTGVLAIAPVSAQTAAINPTAGAVGTSVTVTATGFAPSSIVTATFDNAAVTTAPAVVKTDTNGDVTFALLIPAASAGAHTIRVSDGVNTDTETFTVQPRVTITPTKGPVGTSATVTGSGFTPGVTADVTVGGASFKRMAAIDSDGSFTAQSTIPVVPSGAQDVTAVDGAGFDANANMDSFTVTPTLALSPNSGLAGSKAGITGKGWAANQQVTFNFGGAPWAAATTTASATGTLDITGVMTLPTAQPGVKSVVGFDGTNTAAATFTVDPRLLTLSPNSGPMGTKVLITGDTMTPDGTIDVGMLLIGGIPWNNTAITIDTAGVISPTSLVVPTGLLKGENIVAAIDNVGLAAGNLFIVTQPTVSVTPATGPKGSPVTVQGSGWVPNSTVTLNFAGAPMTVIADANGNIAAAMSVPATATTGPNSLSAAGTLGNVAEDATFTVPGASISVSPGEGGPGEAVTISGNGFAGYAAITVTFGSYPLPITPLASPFGVFELATTVPGVAPGSQVVQASDGPSTATTFFVVKKAAETVQTALASIMDDLDIVWDYAGGDWLFYDPDDVEGSDLTGLVAGTGYWVKVTKDVTLIYGGHQYDLVTGWNNIGWQGV